MFFWKGISSCLTAFRGCITQGVNVGTETLLWKDRWLNGRAHMLLWPDEFRDSSHQNNTLRELAHLLSEAPCLDNPVTLPLWERLFNSLRIDKNKKWWTIAANRFFTVKSLYTFVIDGGMQCPISQWF